MTSAHLTGYLLAAGATETVQTGPFLVAAGLSIAAGAVSFASPCVVPLVPGYLSYLAGLVGGAETPKGGTGVKVRSRAVVATAVFVLGFTVAFLAQSALALGLVNWINANRDVITRVGGVLTILVGIAMLGFMRPLQFERRFHGRPGTGVIGALLLGVFFGVGWTVCLGPTLTGVLSLSYATDWNGNAWRGLFLVLFYCAGLGIPFLLLAFGFGWATSALGFLRRNSRIIQVIGALCLIAIGLAMVTGLWGNFLAWLQNRTIGTETLL